MNEGGPGLHSKPLAVVIGQLLMLTLYCPGGGQWGCMQGKKRKETPYLTAILLALAVHRYNTKHIAQWKGSRAMTKATGRRHWASMAADSTPLDTMFSFFFKFFSLSTFQGA